MYHTVGFPTMYVGGYILYKKRTLSVMRAVWSLKDVRYICK